MVQGARSTSVEVPRSNQHCAPSLLEIAKTFGMENTLRSLAQHSSTTTGTRAHIGYSNSHLSSLQLTSNMDHKIGMFANFCMNNSFDSTCCVQAAVAESAESTVQLTVKATISLAALADSIPSEFNGKQTTMDRPAGRASSFEVRSCQNIQQRRDWADSEPGQFPPFFLCFRLNITGRLMGPVLRVCHPESGSPESFPERTENSCRHCEVR